MLPMRILLNSTESASHCNTSQRGSDFEIILVSSNKTDHNISKSTDDRQLQIIGSGYVKALPNRFSN